VRTSTARAAAAQAVNISIPSGELSRCVSPHLHPQARPVVADSTAIAVRHCLLISHDDCRATPGFDVGGRTSPGCPRCLYPETPLSLFPISGFSP
jgi:hypothetical protein